MSTYDNNTKQLLLASASLLVACVAENPDYDSTAGQKRVFVTETEYYGGDPSESERPGQLICDQAVTSAGLGGTWVPWLSYHIVYPVHAIDTVQDVGPWHDLDGTLIFANKSSLLEGPAAPLRLTERKTELPLSAAVWTGTRQDGTRGDNLCFSVLPYRVWYSATADKQGDIGRVGSLNGAWTSAGTLPCNQSAHIICIEQ